MKNKVFGLKRFNSLSVKQIQYIRNIKIEYKDCCSNFQFFCDWRDWVHDPTEW